MLLTEEDFHLQPLPQLLDIDDHQADIRSTLGGFFKPKYRDFPRNNVHRTSERQHKEVIDCGTNRHRGSVHTITGDSNIHRDATGGSINHRHDRDSTPLGGSSTSISGGKLPRTQYPPSHRQHHRDDHRDDRDGSHSPVISHNKYLPKKRRSSRGYSPTRRSSKHQLESTTAFNGRLHFCSRGLFIRYIIAF